jgi:very-short-patch-repair endonuclease
MHHALRELECTVSSLERIVHKYLNKVGVVFETQKEFRPYFVDIFIPSLNLVVECDGIYWHTRPGIREYDYKRDQYLIKQYGIKIVRVPEKYIHADPKRVVSAILTGRAYSAANSSSSIILRAV